MNWNPVSPVDTRYLRKNGHAEPAAPSPYGERYVIDFELTTATGTATVRTAWMVRNGEDFARLTSCYVLKDVE